MSRIWWFVLALSLIFTTLAIIAASAHDAYSNLTNGQNIKCCGGNDCAPFDGETHQVRGGWIVDGEFVSDDKVLPSFDVQYHRCYWNRETRCFLVPGSS